MSKSCFTVICSIFLLLTFGVTGVLSSQTHNIPWSTLNEGGKTEEATSTSYRLKDAIGQPVIGKCESANYKAYIGFWAPKSLWIVGVEEETGGLDTLPLVYSLSQNYPNPVSNVTEIQYTLPKADWINMRVYNISGQLVKILADELQKPGQYRVSWNGQNEKGRRVSPGVYFYKLQAGNYTETRKMILLR